MIRRVLAWLSYGVAYKADAEATWRPYESPRPARPVAAQSPFVRPRRATFMQEEMDRLRAENKWLADIAFEEMDRVAHGKQDRVLDGIAAATRAEETQRAIAGHVSDRNRIEGIGQ